MLEPRFNEVVVFQSAIRCFFLQILPKIIQITFLAEHLRITTSAQSILLQLFEKLETVE